MTDDHMTRDLILSQKIDKAKSEALTKRELAWRELKLGVDPKYVAIKYGFPEDKMVAAAEKLR